MRCAAGSSGVRLGVLMALLLAAPTTTAGLEIVSIRGPDEPIGPHENHPPVTLEVRVDCSSVLLRQAPGFSDTIGLHVTVDADEHVVHAASPVQPLDVSACLEGAQRANGTAMVALGLAPEAPALAPLEARIRVALEERPLDPASDERQWTLQAKAHANMDVRVLDETIALRSATGNTTLTVTNRGNTPLHVEVVQADARSGTTATPDASPRTLAVGATAEMAVRLTTGHLSGPTPLRFTLQAVSTQDPEATRTVDIEVLALPAAEDLPDSANREALERLAWTFAVLVVVGCLAMLVLVVRRRS